MAEKNWERVESSQINAIAYDPTTRTLAVKFRPNKEGMCSVYRYANCDLQTYQAFKAAPSKGRFFGQSIKGNTDFPYQKMEPEPPEPALEQ